MKPFFEREACRSRAHCHTCRTDASWRLSVGAPDVCPFGVGLSAGLGDIVAKVAQPIASAIDSVLGTNIKGCGGCAARQQKLNELGRRLTESTSLTKQD